MMTAIDPRPMPKKFMITNQADYSIQMMSRALGVYPFHKTGERFEGLLALVRFYTADEDAGDGPLTGPFRRDRRDPPRQKRCASGASA